MTSQCFSTLLAFVLLHHQTDRAKDLQILLLRHQLALVQRKLDKPVRVSRAEKFALTLLTVKLKTTTGQIVKQLNDVLRIFQPETVLKWHRELVRRKWTYRSRARGVRTLGAATREGKRLGIWQNRGRAAKTGLSSQRPNHR